jgi:arsenate reductase
MRRVLVLCTGNSARSQMAEGWLRRLAAGAVEAHSAGTRPSAVNPLAVRAMAERGVDISSHRSKGLEEVLPIPFDVVITVCDEAAESCPTFPGPAERLHWSFPDPAGAEGTEEERLAAFRSVRDGLEARLREWLGPAIRLPAP